MQNEEEIIVNDTDTTENGVNNEQGNEVAPQEDVESLKKTIQTLEAQKEHWREKAEKKAKEAPEQKQSNRKEGDLSTMDIIALSKANIDTEDMPEVLEYAKYKGISVSEALKSPVVKATIQERVEMRTTAEATNTGGAKRSSGRVSDETLMASASKGNIPENDEDLDRLVRAKMFQKR